MKKEALDELMRRAERIHFVGIGGISMSSLAAITKERGYRVTGSDRSESPLTDRLAERGIGIVYRHDRANIEGASLVVYTAAVRDDNPELCAAREKGIPLCSRADYLGWLMRDRPERIGVAGTHGKSTVTSMITGIFLEAGLDPTVVSGAELREMGGAYRVGNGRHFVFEACEYCDSFLSFCPTTAVITNIEYDHADYFKSMEQLRDSFRRYGNIADRVILCADDPESMALRKTLRDGIVTVTFGTEEGADYSPSEVNYDKGCASFTLNERGKALCTVRLSVPGRHNLLNALAAAAAALSCGASPDAVAAGLARFTGAARRFEFMGVTAGGALVYNDYAHHPSELRATLSAAKAFGKRIVAVFQPHTYSRTAGLWEDFVHAFGDSDLTILADIYAARETDTCGVSSRLLAESIPNALYLPSFEAIGEYLLSSCGSGDLILILGAGDIVRLGGMLLTT